MKGATMLGVVYGYREPVLQPADNYRMLNGDGSINGKSDALYPFFFSSLIFTRKSMLKC